MLFPVEVGVGDAQLDKLTRLYKSAYKRIVEELEGATNFGIYNRKALLAQIEKILQGLGVDINEFIRTEIPKHYMAGMDQAVRQIKSFGGGLIADVALNKIHTQMIDLLVGDTLEAFGESITGVKRSAEQLLNKAVKEQIKLKMAEGISMGKTLKEVKTYLSGILANDGLSSLTDKAGHKWTLDRYTEMLIRTKTAEARNRGLMNRSLELDHDLVQVSDHANECPLCHPWEGKILSLTGKTIGYPTLAMAEEAGLFHPNCRHAINIYNEKYAGKLRSFNPETGKYEIA